MAVCQCKARRFPGETMHVDKENLFTEPRVEEAASFAVRSPPNALQHKKRREPKFPPVNGMRSGSYFA